MGIVALVISALNRCVKSSRKTEKNNFTHGPAHHNRNVVQILLFDTPWGAMQ
jgi:hypothetical protein